MVLISHETVGTHTHLTSVVSRRRNEILPRQSNPTSLPGNWSLAGCFTDVSTARTLAATASASDNMTVETCISFCDAGGFIFAGVEFGK